MSEFIPPKKIRQESKRAIQEQNQFDEALGQGNFVSRYEYHDSTLDNPRDYATFQDTFKDLVPEKEGGLRSYIEHMLHEREGRAVGIEFGGPGVRLSESFTPGFFRKTVGVTLRDYRKEENKMDLETHTVLEGDIRKDETYERLDQELKGAKADLIIERLRGGWDGIEDDPILFGKILTRWYELLNENGILFAETPPNISSLHKPGMDFGPLIQKWKDLLDQNYPGTLSLSIGEDRGYGSAVFSLRKLPGAPAKLPLLPIRMLLKD